MAGEVQVEPGGDVSCTEVTSTRSRNPILLEMEHSSTATKTKRISGTLGKFLMEERLPKWMQMCGMLEFGSHFGNLTFDTVLRPRSACATTFKIQ